MPRWLGGPFLLAQAGPVPGQDESQNERLGGGAGSGTIQESEGTPQDDCPGFFSGIPGAPVE